MQYPQLNEVVHGYELTYLGQTLDAGQLPPAALATAEFLLANRPPEGIWITHGLVIAGLYEVLGLAPKRRLSRKELIPRFCEIRVLPI